MCHLYCKTIHAFCNLYNHFHEKAATYVIYYVTLIPSGINWGYHTRLIYFRHTVHRFSTSKTLIFKWITAYKCLDIILSTLPVKEIPTQVNYSYGTFYGKSLPIFMWMLNAIVTSHCMSGMWLVVEIKWGKFLSQRGRWYIKLPDYKITLLFQIWHTQITPKAFCLGQILWKMRKSAE